MVFQPFTRADGTLDGPLAAPITAAYSALRVAATVPGYPERLVSQEQTLPFS